MILLSAASLALAQLVSAQPSEENRLQLCLTDARRDPATAIDRANAWLAEGFGVERSRPLQCLGTAYVSLLRWEAAEDAFAAARDARPAADPAGRARLGAMAGNAALAANNPAAARALFDTAQADATAAGSALLAGEIATDRSRALVALNEPELAAQALELARTSAPQLPEAWLLSATLARRQGRIADAAGMIGTAAALAPEVPAVGLEAGLIAMLAGDGAAARKSWQSVIALGAATAEAETARGYLAQLGPAAAEARP